MPELTEPQLLTAILQFLFDTRPGWVTLGLGGLWVIDRLLDRYWGTKAERTLERTIDTALQQIVQRLERLIELH